MITQHRRSAAQAPLFGSEFEPVGIQRIRQQPVVPRAPVVVAPPVVTAAEPETSSEDELIAELSALLAEPEARVAALK